MGHEECSIFQKGELQQGGASHLGSHQLHVTMSHQSQGQGMQADPDCHLRVRDEQYHQAALYTR
jgi:hypothetical protein